MIIFSNLLGETYHFKAGNGNLVIGKIGSTEL